MKYYQILFVRLLLAGLQNADQALPNIWLLFAAAMLITHLYLHSSDIIVS